MIECISNKRITLRIGNEEVVFDIDQSIKKPITKDDECFRIDDLDQTLHSEAQELMENNHTNLFLFKDLDIDQPDSEKQKGQTGTKKSIRRIEITDTAYSGAQKAQNFKTTRNEHLYSASANEIDEKKPELKDLPAHLEYAFLNKDESCLVIISSKLTQNEKASLLQVLEKHKGAIAWKMPSGNNSSESEQLSKIEEKIEEEVTEAMAETMEQYMSKTRENYGSDITRPTINQDTLFELKGQFLKELYDNTFSGSEHEDANEHIKKVLEIVDLFHIPKVTQDQIMLRAFPVSLTGVASRWLRNQPPGSITTWEILKTKFLNKYYPPTRTAKKIEEINNFQQEPDESLFRAWERFKELLMKCHQHYLTDMQEVILFYNGLDVPTRQILDTKGAIPAKTATNAKIAI
ncbi:retrovirus-related pol polyprotein from transposon TNT 1-94 [Tanacetum coccineum]